MIFFFSVCKFDKAFYTPLVYKSILKFYDFSSYSLIIPDDEITIFKEFISKNNVKNIILIPESQFISFEEFRKIYNKFANTLKIKKSKKNLGWYYQQILKLAYCIKYSKNANIVMVDADTIFLKKVNYFVNGKSIVYSSNYERNIFYKFLCEDILQKKLKKWKSSTIQTFAITKDETENLIKNLQKYYPKDKNITFSYWLTEIILESALKRFHNLNGAYISEQDLIAASNIDNGSMSKSNLKFLRSGVVGELSSFQVMIAEKLNFSYFTYEKWIMKKKSMNFFDFFIAIIVNYPLIHKFLKKIQITLKQFK